MTYEIIPVANGYLLRISSVAPTPVGARAYLLGGAVQEERVYSTLNALINDLRVLLTPTP